MSNLIPGNQKHLTLDDRKIIEDSLNEGLSFKEIAKYLCKDPTTISKEIRLHRVDDIQPKRIFNNPHNFCLKPNNQSLYLILLPNKQMCQFWLHLFHTQSSLNPDMKFQSFLTTFPVLIPLLFLTP